MGNTYKILVRKPVTDEEHAMITWRQIAKIGSRWNWLRYKSNNGLQYQQYSEPPSSAINVGYNFTC
jgi:hypothetical protein